MPDQLSMFDMFTTQPAPQSAPTTAQSAGTTQQTLPAQMLSNLTRSESIMSEPIMSEPIPVAIQASAKMENGYAIFGVARAVITPASWHPSPSEVLSLFPERFSSLDPDALIDLYAHEVDGDGNRIRQNADAHATIYARELLC